MAACVLYRRASRLHHLPGLRRAFARAQHMLPKTEDDPDDLDEKRGNLKRQEIPVQGAYKLHYSPSSYYMWNSSISRSQADIEEDEQCLSSQTPSYWQQSNCYSVSCSRHLFSTKNTLLDFAFNKGAEPSVTSVSPHHKKPIPPDVRVDSRAFLKCRQEYASVSHDRNQRPDLIQWEDAVLVLEKVGVLKGSMKPSDVSFFLTELSRLHPTKTASVRCDPRFIVLLRYTVEHLCLFTDLQLLQVLRSFVWLGIPSHHTVLEVYEAELNRRAKQMTLHELMLAADLWRCIGKQVPRFLQHLYDSVQRRLEQVGLPELVHLLYIIGEGRHCPKDLIRTIEHLLMCHLQQLHPEEVGTICLGLFKSQTSISEGTAKHIVDKAASVVRDMSDFALVNVLKYQRFTYLYHKEWLEAMAVEVPQRAHGMGVKGLMHVALTCSALHYSNDDILCAIAERVPSLVPHCRIKDTCKFLWAFGQLGFPPTQIPGFYPTLIEALRQRKAEFQRYPEHLLTGLLGLAFVSLFPEDLVALALSPDFVNLALKSTQLELKKDLFTLDEAVALEFPQWTGPRLSSDLKEEVTEMLWKFAQSDVCQKPEVTEAESALRDLLGGEEFVCKRMILPHTRSIDLEVHLSPAGKPIPVNTEAPQDSPATAPAEKGWGRFNMGVTITDDLLAQLTKTKTTAAAPSVETSVPLHRLQPDEGERLFDSVLDLTSSIPKPPVEPNKKDPKDIVKVAVQVWTRNHFCVHSMQLLGLHAMKKRQLQMTGYRVVELHPQEWFPLLRKNRTEKLAYLHCKLYDSL
ncbi:FAST kinase domain-containing protein 5, mitochondrial [Salarias fasciatus]|uniref:RAP domain-containing protein n=1 Tax=Salarias fasciatus TaxID=181472 RepID=A0A672JTZ1_SALFA|nr:FAST kinase domain-containing protein 5, mitochondrial [Salarias fasciatus]